MTLSINIFYERIRKLREQQGLSQDELAIRTGYTSRSSIAKIEAGKVDISLSKVELFAEALNTTPSYLLGFNDMLDR